MAQRNTVRWYPVKLDGRAMYLTRDSGVVEYVAHSGGNMCEGCFRRLDCSGGPQRDGGDAEDGTGG